MKTLLLALTFVISNTVFGMSLSDVRPGDILLISLNCYECRVIESETNSLFSHSGVAIKDEEGRIRIAQSLGSLDHFSYADFSKNKTPGTFIHVYRAVELKNISAQKRSLLEKVMLDVFNEQFKHAPFDSKYLWNNFNSKGVELLYCSEFIAKFMDHFLKEKTVPFPVTYQKHIDYWTKYFKGVVPEGELGNSPASFSRDNRFEFVGTI